MAKKHPHSHDSMELDELDKSGNVQKRWVHSASNNIVQIEIGTGASAGFGASLSAWRRTLTEAFLPVGYPHSVTPDYLSYQMYDSLQAFFSTITGLLANRALLQGLGVGDASSSATFALLLTILKDATSRIATIVFAHRLGLAIEPEAKLYRFLADLLNDSAFFLELGSPFLGDWAKVVVLGVAAALRAMCGVAAGASKAALSAHFAQFDNLAELNAKEASQETAVGLMGLLVGSLVVRAVESPVAVFGLMVVLVLCHLWMNYLGVRSVVMNTLNQQRASILYKKYVRTGQILTPAEVSKREAILYWMPAMFTRDGDLAALINFAVHYCDGITAQTRCQMQIYKEMAAKGKAQPYICSISDLLADIKRVRITLMEGCTPKDVAGAWFTAMDIAWGLQDMKTMGVDEVMAFHWKKKEFCDLLVNYGWNLDVQWFETGRPFRLRIVDSKEQ